SEAEGDVDKDINNMLGESGRATEDGARRNRTQAGQLCGEMCIREKTAYEMEGGRSRGLGDVYKRQHKDTPENTCLHSIIILECICSMANYKYWT
ncbi:hypothetical protein B9N14_22525, partial [Escherichia coli]